MWHHSHYDVSHPPVLIMTSFSLWRHSLLSWPRPPLRTYLPRLIYKDRKLRAHSKTVHKQWRHHTKQTANEDRQNRTDVHLEQQRTSPADTPFAGVLSTTLARCEAADDGLSRTGLSSALAGRFTIEALAGAPAKKLQMTAHRNSTRHTTPVNIHWTETQLRNYHLKALWKFELEKNSDSQIHLISLDIP